MRVLLTWELGLNLGHLTRLLPVAQKLKSKGHIVLAAVRDIQAAAKVLGVAGIPFIQAPQLSKGIPFDHRPTGYADILLSQGWSDRSTLWGLTQGWLNIFQLFRPDKLMLDYSPTVSLAARIANIPTVLVGNGFELPPLANPLPPFPGFSWATPRKAEESEKVAVANANAVLSTFKGDPIAALRDFVIDQVRLFATFPELDHYGERPHATYVGPLLGKLNASKVDWPDGNGAKIVVCVKPDTSQVRTILSAIGSIAGRVVCVAAGFTADQLVPFKAKNVKYTLHPVDLAALLDADLFLSYGAEGTMMRLLLHGVPQLISPWHVETYLAARRIDEAHLGRVLPNCLDRVAAIEWIEHAARDHVIRNRTNAFASQKAKSYCRVAEEHVCEVLLI
jgi:UDP:flavonoid glycosyltransferase YjiC (YdhE family)